MIPQFPRFKKLELKDKQEIESFTQNFKPYSDFNFTSLWSWNVDNKFSLSILNENLVVKLTDYLTNEDTFSFLGNHETRSTIITLFEYMRTQNLETVLKMVPEESLLSIDRQDYFIEEDRDNFDYILSFERLQPRVGQNLSTRRRVIEKFKTECTPLIQELDLNDQNVKRSIKEVCSTWELQKGISQDQAEHLVLALSKFLNSENFPTILAFGAYLEGQLIGYSINERVSSEYALGHFMQADLGVFKGIYAYLMQETAPIFMRHGQKYINLEQDLGLPGLRKWKLSYRPSDFLKKYIIRPRLPSYL